MPKTNWQQRLEEAKRALERVARAAQDGSARRNSTTNVRITSRRNVKVVTNLGNSHSTTAAVAQQVAPIHQEHRTDVTDDSSTQGVRKGGDAVHEPGGR